MDLELIAAVGTVGDEDCVVEVSCRLAVDGDDREAAKIPTTRNLGEVEMGDGAGFGEDFFRKDARELMLADHHLDVDAEVVGMAQNFDDAAYGGAGWRGPTGDFDVDDQALEGVVRGGGGSLGAQDAVRRCGFNG